MSETGVNQEAAVNEVPGIYFIHAPCWGVGSPPHGAAYVSAYLQSKGFSVTVRDLNVELYNRLKGDHDHLWKQESYRIWELGEPFYKTLLPLFSDWLEGVVEEIVAANPRVACFSINVASVIFSIHLARQLKRRIPWLTTIFGGTQCRFGVGNLRLPPGLFAAAQGEPGLVDAVVLGEGEITCAKLVRQALAGKPLVGIQGAVTLRDGFFGNFTPRPPVKDLDQLGSPTFEGYPVQEYRDNHLPVLLSRGCLYGCTFCNERLQYPNFRSRSGRHVFQEVARNQNRYGVRAFHFCDLVVNGQPDRLAEYADLMTWSRRPSDWCGQAVIHPGLDDALLAKLKASGCDNLIFGIETFSPRISKLMGKPYPPDMADKVLRACHKNGVGTVINIIVGYPGETDMEFQETLDGLRRNAEYISMVSSVSECHVPPGSILEQRCERFGLNMPTKDGFMYWSIPGNDHDVRMERMTRVLDLLKELDLGYYKTTRYNETLKENLQHENAVAIVPDMMTTDAGPDRSTAAYSFINTSAEETGPKGPSSSPTGDTMYSDPGKIFSPLTPMPEPFYLLGQGKAQLRLGGRGVDIFHDGKLISRGGGITAQLDLGRGMVLSSDGATWCYALEEDHVVACLQWPGDHGVWLYLRIGVLGPDRFLIGYWIWFEDEQVRESEVEVRLGVNLYDQLCDVTAGGEALGQPRIPSLHDLAEGAASFTLGPRPGAAVQAKVTLDLGEADIPYTLSLEGDSWLEGIHAALGFRCTCDLITRRAELTVTTLPAGDEAKPEAPVMRRDATLAVDLSHSPLETLAKPIFISRVQLFTPDISGENQDGIFIAPNSRFTVRCWIYCREPVDNPLLRVQIHHGWEKIPALVGANNYRQDARLELAQGCFTRVDVVIEQLNLAPGEYALSLALSASEEHTDVFSFLECCYNLYVTGDAGRARGHIWQPEAGLSALEGTESPALREVSGGLSLASIHPKGQPDAICMAVGPGSVLELELNLDGRSPDPEELEEVRVRIFSSFPQVELVSFPVPLPSGDHAGLLLRISELNLLGGDHRLEIIPEAKEHDGQAITLHVRQKRGQGGGLVYCHYHLVGMVLPKPGDLESLGGDSPTNLLIDEG